MPILIVDDNEINLEMQKLMLESCGLEAETADSGEKAVELAEKNDYSVILMDIKMTPGIDGFTATERIRKFNKSVPIIALSADLIPKDDKNYIKSGMNGALQKPIQLAKLKEALSNYVKVKEENNEMWRRKTDIIFDKDELLSMLSDERALNHILQQFLDIHRNDGEIIKDYIENEKIGEARALLHDITGISGNLYCCRLYVASSRMSAELKGKAPYNNYINTFLDVWNQTVGKLAECCNELSHKHKAETDVKVDWETLWSDFVDLCKDFDIKATELFNKNLATFASHFSEEKFEKIKIAVNRYDYLSILEIAEGENV